MALGPILIFVGLAMLINIRIAAGMMIAAGILFIIERITR